MTGMRDRLLNRERPVAHYPCRVATVEETETAERALALAKQAARGVKEDDKAAAHKVKKLVEDAEAKRNACYEQIPLRALPPADFEALSDVYPPAPEDADHKVRQAADEAYLHAVFLASVEGDLTEDEWTSFVHSNLSTGERNDLYNLGVAVNGRVRALDPATPKGSIATRS